MDKEYIRARLGWTRIIMSRIAAISAEVEFLQSEIQVWKAKETAYREALRGMKERLAAGDGNVTSRAIERMEDTVQNCMDQQRYKEEHIDRTLCSNCQ